MSVNDPRPTGWEYYGLMIKPTGAEPVTVNVVMREVAEWSRPEHGGWELMLPFMADTPEPGAVTVLLKRPLSTLVTTRTEIPAPFLELR